MRGATAPRLLLELICARVLLPGADHGTDGLLARLDRIEKRMSIEGTPSAAGGAPARAPRPHPSRSGPASTPEPAAAATAPSVSAGEAAARPSPLPAPEPTAPSEPVAQPAAEPDAQPAQPAASSAAESEPVAGGLSLVEVRRLWPDLLEAVKLKRRFTWILLARTPRSSPSTRRP